MSRQFIKDYSYYFQEYPFELLITTRLPDRVPIDKAHQHLVIEVLDPLTRHLSQKIAAISVISPKILTEPKHIHSLVLSETTASLSNSINDIKMFMLDQPKGILLTHLKACDVKVIYELSGAADYVANHLNPEGSLLKFYKERLLHKKRREN